MADKRYKMDKLVANAMHFPAVGSKNEPLFLYTKVPEYTGGKENIESTYAKNSKYAEWVRAKDKIYGSPRNIRSVYIHKRGVEVTAFIEPVGTSSRRHSREYPVDITAENVTGNALRALSSPLVCSNIEEIYIDYELIRIAIETDSQFIDELSRSGVNIRELDSITRGNIIAQSKLPKVMLDISNGGVLSRVRTVAITNRLFEGREKEFLISANSKNGYARSYEVRADEIKSTGCSIIVSNVSENNSSYGNISTSPNIYLFDRNVLVQEAERFRGHFIAAVNSKKDNKTENKELNTGGNKLVQEILVLKSNYGDRVASMIVNTAISTMRKSDREQIEKIIKDIL